MHSAGSAWAPAPGGLEYEDGTLFVAYDGGRIIPFETSGRRVDRCGGGRQGRRRRHLETADGRIWVTYRDDRALRQFDASTVASWVIPLATVGRPVAVNIGADGRVWLARADGALLQVRPDGGDALRRHC